MFGKVYINLHPETNYAMVIVAEYVDLRHYVENVDWLSWLWGKRNQLMIRSSNGNGTHIERANVFAQRLFDAGHEVYIRNERTDDWTIFAGRQFDEIFMNRIESEVEGNEQIEKLARIERNLSTYHDRVLKFKELGKEVPDWLIEALSDTKKEQQILLSKEQERMKNLKNIRKVLNKTLEEEKRHAEFMEREKQRLIQEGLL